MLRRSGDFEKSKKFCLVLCLFFMGAGLVMQFRSSKYLFRQFTCTETVDAVAAAPDAKTTTTTGKRNKKRTTTYYHPVFTYTYQNRSYKGYYDLSDSKNYYPAGTAVKLKIDPDDPDTFYVVDDPMLRRNLLEAFGTFMIGAVPLALYYLCKHTNLLDKEIGGNRPPTKKDEELMRIAMAEHRARMEWKAEQQKEHEQRRTIK